MQILGRTGSSGTVVAPFVFSIDTTLGTGDTFQLPLDFGGTYNFVVDWDDGNTDTITAWDQAETNHTYAAGGIYDISITGVIKGWRCAYYADAVKITDLKSWGTLKLGAGGAYFGGCQNMVVTATDILDLSESTDLYGMFGFCTALTEVPSLLSWDMSTITDIQLMFYLTTVFNQDLSTWDVSHVTNMNQMFFWATGFNQDVSGWDVSNVTNMGGMFSYASIFDQDISGWDVSSVTDMSYMFQGAAAFNQDLSVWDTSSVNTMAAMFYDDIVFNQDISGWDVSSVFDMNNMFTGVTLSTANYDALLIGWAAQSVQSGVTFGAGNSQLTGGGAAAAAKADLTTVYSWTINDGGELPYFNGFAFDPVAGTVIAEVGLTTYNIYAIDQFSVPFAGYDGTNFQLVASSGNVAMSGGSWSGGIWTGTLTFDSVDAAMDMTASDTVLGFPTSYSGAYGTFVVLACDADFTLNTPGITYAMGEVPLTVGFFDTTTTGSPLTGWDWDWGDGTAHGATQDPSHTYTSAGYFTVILTATNALGSDSETKVCIAVAEWSEIQPAGNVDKNWQCLTSDQDASVIVAGVASGRLYYSINDGATWNECQPAGNVDKDWYALACAMSSGPTVAGVNGGRLYTATNPSGIWTERQPAGNVDRNWRGATMDEYGQRIYAVAYGGRAYKSVNSGVGWSEITPAGSSDHEWTSVSCNQDGTKVVLCEYGGRIWRSTNTGSSWTELRPAGDVNKNWIWVEADRQQCATIFVTDGLRLYGSLNSGATWTELQPAGAVDYNWNCISCNIYYNFAGQAIIAGAGVLGTERRLWDSWDQTTSWQETRPAGNVDKQWYRVHWCDGGNKAFAAVYGGRVYELSV